ncbi:hypothetical protein GGTG_01124 [Gaeumannomyces tritici R3-111a-1]|uniref:Thiaminase-2/PQQC domain-containing protein n=1 Tax=Gaeumannomyces tritici (strain R3-111a-1) TaxID=644352 RepID=J3NIP1_GAET3|nr:hypothetical protein GGTG_01124 [Gaeumannomyces tritici R3-111a-1]EJT81140.1 hypothetical protein GGTG_01124 [Gaeumannomyces tritici R3-111a-1]
MDDDLWTAHAFIVYSCSGLPPCGTAQLRANDDIDIAKCHQLSISENPRKTGGTYPEGIKSHTHYKMTSSNANIDATWSLTEHLLESNQASYQAATQSPFLLAAAQGRLSKELLGRWLANDRLYIHSYIKAAGRVLDAVDLDQTSPAAESSPEAELVGWVVEALVGLRREEVMFADVARRYGLDLALDASPDDPRRVLQSAKLPGLVQFEALFASVLPRDAAAAAAPTPAWLEAAVLLWGTERIYLDAWSWARAQRPGKGEDADGGAVRREFMPNWTNPEFAAFVSRLGRTLDRAVGQALAAVDPPQRQAVQAGIVERTAGTWNALLAAEAAFWPGVDG